MIQFDMEKLLGKLFSVINPIGSYFFITLFSFVNRIRNRKKVLIYTDSRGFEVTKFWNRKNPFSSYVKYFIFRYACDVYICPHKFTSLLDFLNMYKASSKKYDFVILHCGIVDFAPRPQSSFNLMYEDKQHLINNYDLGEKFKFETADNIKYEGEYTSSFLNKNVINSFIVPELRCIHNLIYVSINPVLDSWRGLYWRDRPENINDQLILDKELKNKLPNVIDLGGMSKEKVKEYTTDNVHYNQSGFEYIRLQLVKLIKANKSFK